MNFGLNKVKTYTLQSQLSVFSLSFKKLNTLTYLIFSCFDFFSCSHTEQNQYNRLTAILPSSQHHPCHSKSNT